MHSARISVVTIAAGAIAITALVFVSFAQQGQPSPERPSEQPRPANSQPRPAGTNNPAPDAAVPPATQSPVAPAGQPGRANCQPGTVGVTRDGSGNVVNGIDNRYQRPFAFQTPAYESRFAESSQRLVAMEQRLTRSNQDLMRRLGDARALSGDRQSAAMLDILQQVLIQQAAMNQYLVRARTAWSGDLEGSTPLVDDPYWETGMPANSAIPPSTQEAPAPADTRAPEPKRQTP